MFDVPVDALVDGFVNEPVGSHTSRTIMLEDLRHLLSVYPAAANLEVYRRAVVDENVLGKGTRTTRVASLRQLRELYALDPTVLLFRALRDLWESDAAAQPLLALLCATARDPILRATTGRINDLPIGQEVTSEELAAAVQRAFPDRYLASVRRVIGRNVLGSWRQSGHISPAPGRQRTRVEPHPPSVAYALFLGHRCGARGDELFKTLWCQLLDAPMHLLRELAITASRHGWLEYRHAGTVTDVSFRHLERGGEVVPADAG